MTNKHIWTMGIIGILTLAACSDDPAPRADPPPDPAQIAAARARLQTMVEAERQAAHAGTVPPDYQTQIDARFAQTLIDPNSRRIEFLKAPYGGLVCGAVNAKDRFGQYSGRHPFFAIFSPGGMLLRLNQFSPEELAITGHDDLGAITDCGFQDAGDSARP